MLETRKGGWKVTSRGQWHAFWPVRNAEMPAVLSTTFSPVSSKSRQKACALGCPPRSSVETNGLGARRTIGAMTAAGFVRRQLTSAQPQSQQLQLEVSIRRRNSALNMIISLTSLYVTGRCVRLRLASADTYSVHATYLNQNPRLNVASLKYLGSSGPDGYFAAARLHALPPNGPRTALR